MSEWKEYKLKDVASFSQGIQVDPNVQKSEAFNNSVRFIRIVDFTKGTSDEIRYIDNPGERYLVEEDDLVMIRYGSQTAGKIARGFKGAIANNTFKISLDKNILDKSYVYYYLAQNSIFDFFHQSQASSTMPAITFDMIGNLEILAPSISEQIQIASILSSLDDKINLLHRQNKTLEQLAETLFRWFSEDADESWVVGKLEDVISVKGGTTPSTTNPAFWNGNIHWTSPRDLSNSNSIFLFNTDRKITEEGLKQIGSGVLPIGTVLLSSRAPIGYLVITEIPVAINQGYIAIVCDKIVSNYFIYLWVKRNLETIISAANGSVFLEISKSIFKELKFIIPPKSKLELFDESIEPLFQKIKTNIIEIRTLTELREELLPKLMSGEIRTEVNG